MYAYKYLFMWEKDKWKIKKNEVRKENYHTVLYLETFSDDQFCKNKT